VIVPPCRKSRRRATTLLPDRSSSISTMQHRTAMLCTRAALPLVGVWHSRMKPLALSECSVVCCYFADLASVWQGSGQQSFVACPNLETRLACDWSSPAQLSPAELCGSRPDSWPCPSLQAQRVGVTLQALGSFRRRFSTGAPRHCTVALALSRSSAWFGLVLPLSCTISSVMQSHTQGTLKAVSIW
jgi:hypothetical protein